MDSDVQAEYSIGVELNAVELIHSLFVFDLQNLVLSMSLLQFNFLLHQVFFQDVVLIGCDREDISFILDNFPEPTGIVHISQRIEVLQEVALSLHDPE